MYMERSLVQPTNMLSIPHFDTHIDDEAYLAPWRCKIFNIQLKKKKNLNFKRDFEKNLQFIC